MEPIILASSSPRRQEILKELNIPNLAKGHAKLRVEFYEKIGETKEKNQALLDYFMRYQKQ